MQPTDDGTLLRQYSENRSDDAFAALVTRHINLVYSVALRQVGDPHQAEEITQAVFILLAKKAAQLRRDKALSSWLFQATRLTARNFVRGETRRHHREQEAHMQSVLNESGGDIWPRIAPFLDDAVAGLSEEDRHAIVLRFYEGRNLREVGAALGASEDAAEKRVNRAVEKLRTFFAKRGVTVGASGLVVVISANAVQAAPVGLAVTVSTAAGLAGTTLATTATVTATKAIAMTILQKTLVTAAVAVLAVAGIYEARQASRLREQNISLRQQMTRLQTENESLSDRLAGARALPTLSLPAPSLPKTVATAAPTEDLQSTNLLARVAERPPRLTAEQAEKFLDDNHRSASSLLAAFRTTGNAAYLDEAMQRFPDDPQVAFEAVVRKGMSPEDKRHWLDILKKSAPDNPLANYLSAREYFNSGQTDQAVQELIAASGKTRFTDYFLDRLQANEEAFRAAGYSEFETRVGGAVTESGPDFSHFQALRELTVKMVELANSYRQAGDQTSAQAALQMAVSMGDYFGTAGMPPVKRAFGFAIELAALGAMDPTSPYGPDGKTVKDQLDYVAGEKAANLELIRQLDILYPKATPQDMITFLDRAKLFGDKAAMEWLKQKYGDK
jgi:RNA polymerase sigma factor (sigma-70 family)